MATPSAVEISKIFTQSSDGQLPADVMGELQYILRLHSISPQELFYKWESYSINMGTDETGLTLDNVKGFKANVQETLERENRSKAHPKSAEKRGPTATPRNISSNSDVFGMLDALAPKTPHSAVNGASGNARKRKAAFETPGTSKVGGQASPMTRDDASLQNNENGDKTGYRPSSFAARANAGQVTEVLNEHLSKAEAPLAPAAEARVKIKANTDLKKFSYRPMAMHLSEASEVLDDRIDEFTTLVQAHHNLSDAAFGSAASQSTSDVVAVGRIASDALEAKPNVATLVLETSRRTGAGLRVPLKLDGISSFDFFPGQIVALRGVNASGDYFTVTEILDIPLLGPAASTPAELDSHTDLLHGGPDAMDDDNPRPLSILLGSGPFTPDDDLNYDALNALCDHASETYADVLILTGPFLDAEHPLIATGDFDIPTPLNIDPDTVTLTTVFRALVSAPLRRLADAVPNITIILVPSVRDAISKHVSWPQEQFPRKDLGLPKQARLVSNPMTLSLNELTFGISSQDVLAELRQEEVFSAKPKTANMLERLSRHLIEQRHFFPLFPPTPRTRLMKTAVGDAGLPTGAMIDTGYLKLGEWLTVRPDVLITPSLLPPFAKIIESVLVINPGSLSKRKAPGTYAKLTVHAAKVTAEERAEGKRVGHKIHERGRVDIVRI
ncbi:MAG: DNA-directed DNA polymerase alpha subunit pol12 [Piccolia ochrophora]|nr:MAG: DNA-directed DNA polymerase alpha subunit pol12 [Piccolia ochrophora]